MAVDWLSTMFKDFQKTQVNCFPNILDHRKISLLFLFHNIQKNAFPSSSQGYLVFVYIHGKLKITHLRAGSFVIIAFIWSFLARFIATPVFYKKQQKKIKYFVNWKHTWILHCYITRKHSSRMPTTRSPTVYAVIATRCQHHQRGGSQLTNEQVWTSLVLTTRYH